MRVSVSYAVAIVMTSCLFVGCAGDADPESATSPDPGDTSAETGSTSGVAAASDAESDDGASPTKSYKPIQLGGSSTAASSDSTGSGGTAAASTEPPKFEEVVAALKPIQIMLGKWQGLIRKASKSEMHDWVWDLKTDPVFPALVLSIPDGEFFKSARLTYDPRIEKFLMTTVDEEEVKRSFTGEFVVEPKDVPSEDGKTVERTFQLELTENEDSGRGIRFQYVFKQQHNNRYLVDVNRARGRAKFSQFDVIGSQRDGVSFAKADDDYGDKTCIISGGLGTSTVTYKGKTFYVCCSGCKAAFDDEPERWIARMEEQKAEKMKANN
ncbi:MAG: hypothetical protein ACKVII_22035 [Planctomycetales bacterium]|jgi:hypothetical protein